MQDRKRDRSNSAMQTDAMTRKNSIRLGRDIQSKIGLQLRAMYDDVVKEGVPDRFSELLSKLDERQNKDKDAG